MPFLIDTDVAIHLRDNDPRVHRLVDGMGERPAISAMTRIELEGGLYTRPELTERRTKALNLMERELPIIDVTVEVARAYGQIVAKAGFSRRKIADRIVAATALALDLDFATLNARDFRDIQGLRLIAWDLAA